MVDVADMKLDDVVAMIRGAAGTMRLGVMPEAATKSKPTRLFERRLS